MKKKKIFFLFLVFSFAVNADENRFDILECLKEADGSHAMMDLCVLESKVDNMSRQIEKEKKEKEKGRGVLVSSW